MLSPLAHAAPSAATGAAQKIDAPANAPDNPQGDAQNARTILVLGDSLSAGYGLPRNTGWVYLLEQRLAAQAGSLRSHYSVSNASISGDTTSGGVSRLPALLTRLHPVLVIVELGGNDALRGLPLTTTRSNLQTIVTTSRASGAQVLLVGMQIPPNYGQAYTQQFSALYADLAKRDGVSLVPFLLEGIADKPELFQADQIHPLPQAQPVLLDNVWKVLQPLIESKLQPRPQPEPQSKPRGRT